MIKALLQESQPHDQRKDNQREERDGSSEVNTGKLEEIPPVGPV